MHRLGQVSSKGTGSLYGPSETVTYLKSLGKQHIDLVLEFSRWALQSSPDEALTVLPSSS